MPDPLGARFAPASDAASAPGRIPLALWNAATWLAVALFGLCTSTILIWRYGQADFGVWSTLSALRGFLLFLDAGLAFGVSRDVVLERQDSTAAARVRAAFTLYAGLGGLVLVGGFALAMVPGRLLHLEGAASSSAQWAMRALGVESALALASAPLWGVLRGQQRFQSMAVAHVVQAVLGTLLLLATPRGWGLWGAALVLLLARLLLAAWATLAVRRTRPELMSVRPLDRGALAQVVRFALPMWVVAGATQVGLGTDVPLVGAFHGALLAGQYALGATLPTVCIGLLYALLDAYYPRAAASQGALTGRLIEQLMRAGCALAGLGLGCLVAVSAELLTVWVGSAPELSRRIALLYACTWAINVPTHVLVLIAIAGAQHRLLAPLAVAEALANLALSVVLVRWRVDGPALATLLTLCIWNVGVLPGVILSRLQLGWMRPARAAVEGYAIGVAGSLGVWAVLTLLPASPALRVAAAMGGASLLGALTVGWFFRRQGGVPSPRGS